MSGLELIAAVLGVTAVWLTVKQNAWCWPIGLVMVLIYGWLFFEVKLYSGMLLQLAYAILQLYGWWQWKRPGHAEDARQVSRLQRPALLSGLAAGLLLSAALGAAMANWTDAALPWLDATLTGFSLVAQLWMAQKRLQCWPLWVVVDIVYVGQYLHQQLYFTAGFFAVLTLIAVRGWLEWRRDPALVQGMNAEQPMKVLVLCGPESSGKSWLSGVIQAHFGGVVVPEYVRHFIDQECRDTCYADIPTIARGQLAWEDRAREQAPPLLIP